MAHAKYTAAGGKGRRKQVTPPKKQTPDDAVLGGRRLRERGVPLPGVSRLKKGVPWTDGVVHCEHIGDADALGLDVAELPGVGARAALGKKG